MTVQSAYSSVSKPAKLTTATSRRHIMVARETASDQAHRTTPKGMNESGRTLATAPLICIVSEYADAVFKENVEMGTNVLSRVRYEIKQLVVNVGITDADRFGGGEEFDRLRNALLNDVRGVSNFH